MGAALFTNILLVFLVVGMMALLIGAACNSYEADPDGQPKRRQPDWDDAFGTLDVMEGHVGALGVSPIDDDWIWRGMDDDDEALDLMDDSLPDDDWSDPAYAMLPGSLYHDAFCDEAICHWASHDDCLCSAGDLIDCGIDDSLCHFDDGGSFSDWE